MTGEYNARYNYLNIQGILEEYVFRARTSVQFKVTENHVKLLKCLWIDWDKREIGNYKEFNFAKDK